MCALPILDDSDAEARRSARIPPSDGIVTRRACARLIERPVDRETRVVVEPRNMPAHRRGVMEFRIDAIEEHRIGRTIEHLHAMPVVAKNPDSALREHDVVVQQSEEHTSELQSLMRISYAVF